MRTPRERLDRRGNAEAHSPEQIQSHYYVQTAGSYDALHVNAEDEHGIAARYISMFAGALGAKSILDVGCGTGRGVRYFMTHHPSIKVVGIEPVREMLGEAVRNGIPSDSLVRGSGDRLPFPDGSFDIVCAFGVLHHVPNPDRVLAEMVRVASTGVFVSDTNRFGNGAFPFRIAKVGLSALRLWDAFDRLKTRGTGYRISSGDGLSYSYSVFDSLRTLSNRMPYAFTIPTKRSRPPGLGDPLLTASHGLLCGLKRLPK